MMDNTELIYVFERFNAYGAFRQTLDAIRTNRLFTAAHLARVERAWVVNCGQPGSVCRQLNVKALPIAAIIELDRAIDVLDARARHPIGDPNAYSRSGVR